MAAVAVSLVAGVVAAAAPATADPFGNGFVLLDCEGFTYINRARQSDYFADSAQEQRASISWIAREKGFDQVFEDGETLADLWESYFRDTTMIPSPTSSGAWIRRNGDALVDYEFGDEQSIYIPVREPVFDELTFEFVPGELIWETTVHKPDTCDYPILGDVSETSFARQDIKDLFDLEITNGTSATTYGPSERVSRAQMAAFIDRAYAHVNGTPAPVVAVPFTDMPGNFADDSIRRIFGLEITNGTSPTTYSPSGDVTREQMAAFLMRLYRALGGETPAAPDVYPFTDVSAGSFARDDIAALKTLGITTGTSATTYSPGDFVTREQMAAFLMRLIRLFD